MCVKIFLKKLLAADPLLKWPLFLLGGAYLLNFGFLGFLIGPFDYDHLSGYYELAWRFWQSGAFVPHFNPYLCGGRPLGADPQIPIYHPIVLLVPLLGATWVIKLELLFQLALGSWGLWKLLEYYGCADDQKFWGLFAFAAGGGVVSRFMVGHVTLGFFFLFPAFFYVLRSFLKKSIPQKAGLYFFLFLYSALYKPNFILLGFPLLFLDAFLLSLLHRRWSLFLRTVGTAGVACLVLCVIYLPAFFYFQENPRKDGSDPLLIYWGALVSNFLLPLKAVPDAWYGFGAIQHHEFSQFVGPGVIYLAIRGFARKRISERGLYGTLFFVSLWLGIGSPTHVFHPLFLFSWLRDFWPGFHSIRVTPRFWIGAYCIVILFSCFSFRLPQTKKGRGVFFTFVILPLLGNGIVNLFKPSVLAYQTQWSTPRKYPQELFFVEGSEDESYSSLKKGQGVLRCVENLEVKKSPLLAPGNLLRSTGNVKGLDWSTYEVKGASPLLLNFNFSKYWSFEGQGTLSEREGLVQILPVNQQIEGVLRYRIPRMPLFVATSVFFLGMVLLLGAKCCLPTKVVGKAHREIR